MSNRRSMVYLILGIILASVAYVMCPSRGSVRNLHGLGNTLVSPRLGFTQLVIERNGAPRIVLERQNEWRMIAPYGGAVDNKIVLKMLDVLAFTPVSDRLSMAALADSGKSVEDFGLNRAAVTLTLSGGLKMTRLAFGDKTAASNEVYVALIGGDAVATVPVKVLEAVDLCPADLRERALVGFDPESIESFSIKNANAESVEFNRRDGGWFAMNQVVSTELVKGFLERLSAAEARTFIWPVGSTNESSVVTAAQLAGYGLEPENAITITLRDSPTQMVRLGFGGEASSNEVYVSAWNDTAVVTADATLKAMVVKGMSGFVDSRLFPMKAVDVKAFSIEVSNECYGVSFNAQGNRWELCEPVVAPADADRVDGFVRRLLKLNLSDRAADGIRVSVNTNSLFETVSRSVLEGMNPLVFRSLELLNVDRSDIRRLLSVRVGDGDRHKAVVYSAERRVWSVESAMSGVANEEVIGGILNKLSPLKALRTVTLKASAAELSDYGLTHPWLTLAIDQARENSVRRNLLIGGVADGGRYATLGASGEVFVIADDVVEILAGNLITE